jgi:hypothetical protein
MELTITELSQEELDSVFGGRGHGTYCMHSLGAGNGTCDLPCCGVVV